jgi:hypothetical protein
MNSDDSVLLHQPRQRGARKEPDAAHELALLDSPLGDVFLDDIDGHLPHLDQIGDVAIHLRRLGLRPLATEIPGALCPATA